MDLQPKFVGRHINSEKFTNNAAAAAAAAGTTSSSEEDAMGFSADDVAVWKWTPEQLVDWFSVIELSSDEMKIAEERHWSGAEFAKLTLKQLADVFRSETTSNKILEERRTMEMLYHFNPKSAHQFTAGQCAQMHSETGLQEFQQALNDQQQSHFQSAVPVRDADEATRKVLSDFIDSTFAFIPMTGTTTSTATAEDEEGEDEEEEDEEDDGDGNAGTGATEEDGEQAARQQTTAGARHPNPEDPFDF